MARTSRKYTTIDEDAARIDAQRVDPSLPESEYVKVGIGAPVTEFGMRYSETVQVDFEEGRFPAWFAERFASWFRRLDMDPSYGFFVQRYDDDGRPTFGRYQAIPLTALVLREPRYDTGIIDRMRKAAEAAGWSTANPSHRGPGFTAWKD